MTEQESSKSEHTEDQEAEGVEPEAQAPELPKGEPTQQEPELVAEPHDGVASSPRVEDRSGAARRLGRLASGALAAATRPPGGGLSTMRKFMVPLSTLLFLAILLILFKEILLPFILALVIVYIMEPIVGRVGRTPQAPTGLPRWVAVILVYLTFFGVVSATLLLFMPRLISELVRFTETVPQEIQLFRAKTLPDLNKQIQGFVSSYAPPFAKGEGDADKTVSLKMDVEPVRVIVHKARRESAAKATAFAEASRLLNLSAQMSFTEEWEGVAMLQHRIWRAQRTDEVQRGLMRFNTPPVGGAWSLTKGSGGPALRVVPDKQGGLQVYLDDVDLEIVQTAERTWHLKPATELKSVTDSGGELGDKVDKGLDLKQILDLERGLESVFEGLSKSSNAKLTSLLTFAQEIVVGIIQAFVGMILTLMVAAFISIDLHSLMGFFRAMFPEEHRDRFDVLMKEMDRGLSGVVRGQLMICLVNGILTYVGLALLGIKFSLLLALVAGCLSLIPIFGTILSTVPIVLFGLTNGLSTGFFALLWILFIHFLEANILNPKIIGSSAHIHPVIVIFALLAGESTFGLLGALLAVPTASILLTLFKFFFMYTHEEVEPELGYPLSDELGKDLGKEVGA